MIHISPFKERNRFMYLFIFVFDILIIIMAECQLKVISKKVKWTGDSSYLVRRLFIEVPLSVGFDTEKSQGGFMV